MLENVSSFISSITNNFVNYFIHEFINPVTSPGEGVSAFTYPYLSAGAPAVGEAKGLILM